jgi:osmotically-inducible protein OsmY
MKRRLTLLTLTTLAAVALIGVVSRAPSPALAEGATQISGVAVLDEADECDSGSVGADFSLIMDGDLEGCLYTFVETAETSPSGTYRETGTELFVDSDGAGAFETTYRFEAKYEDVANISGEIFGRCQHPIVEGSGTGIYEGVSGRLDFKDDVEAGTFPYRGHLLL